MRRAATALLLLSGLLDLTAGGHPGAADPPGHRRFSRRPLGLLGNPDRRSRPAGRLSSKLNADHFFVPASNTKLFTTALALKRLGPDYTFRTTVRMDAGGSIRLVGGGDPNLSNRAIPYRMGQPTATRCRRSKIWPTRWWRAGSSASRAMSSATIPLMSGSRFRPAGPPTIRSGTTARRPAP